MLQLKIREVRQKIMADIKMDDSVGKPAAGNGATTASENNSTSASGGTSGSSSLTNSSHLSSGMASSVAVTVQQAVGQKVNSTKMQPAHLVRGQQLGHVTLAQAATSMSGLVAVATVTSGCGLLQQGAGVQH